VRAARRDFAGQAAALNGYVPFFLRLREYAETALPAPEEFLDKIAPMLLPPDARSWPRARLESGRAFVLVDGLDELPAARRPAVLAWLRELTDLFPDARYVVTTRGGAIEESALADAGFVDASLEPMDPGLVRVFIDRWHAAMREWEDTESLAQLDGWRERLHRTLDDDRFLSELVNTPLLAGLVCALNQRLGAQLPRRRGEIFGKALAMLHERDRKRGIVGGVALDLDATSHLLGDLALWMTRNARVEIAADAADGMVASDTARGILRQSALSIPARPPESADLYGHLLVRSGVLREPTVGQVDFVHRTFQEYLAAKALIRTDSVREIVRNASDDQWREVVILASGQGITRQTTELLRGLLGPSWQGRDRYRRRLLAVACLDEIRDADPDVLAEIDRVIPELLPPRDMDQAEALSHAGERLLPHLERATAGAADQQLLPVIRAAALIGGPRALNLIATIAARPGGTEQIRDVRRAELARARLYFDPRRYGELV
jgi:predicted NACHT family NTPase